VIYRDIWYLFVSMSSFWILACGLKSIPPREAPNHIPSTTALSLHLQLQIIFGFKLHTINTFIETSVRWL